MKAYFYTSIMLLASFLCISQVQAQVDSQLPSFKAIADIGNGTITLSSALDKLQNDLIGAWADGFKVYYPKSKVVINHEEMVHIGDSNIKLYGPYNTGVTTQFENQAGWSQAHIMITQSSRMFSGQVEECLASLTAKNTSKVKCDVRPWMVFLDFILSKEGQTVAAKAGYKALTYKETMEARNIVGL